MNLFERLAARKKIVDAFRLILDKTPLINNVIHTTKYTRYSFTIPLGTDPKILHDKFYVFQQFFGANTEISGGIKQFQLTVYHDSLPSELTYCITEWQPVIKGMAIPVITGVDAHGNKIAYDMAKQPHLLVSGETGSGKSSLLRAILTTLMLTKRSNEVRFILGDLKLSEFGVFRNVPHVDGVYFEAEDLEAALTGVRNEMKKRGRMLAAADVPHIKDLPEKLPFIVVAIDEVALLRKEKALMDIIEDISSIGRSLGVLLMLSMQRPDAQVLDGRLKNNLTVRISGRQSNEVNAKVAGTPGAELIKLGESGRMILASDTMQQLQTPFITFEEAKRLLGPLKNKGERNLVRDSIEPLFEFGILGRDK